MAIPDIYAKLISLGLEYGKQSKNIFPSQRLHKHYSYKHCTQYTITHKHNTYIVMHIVNEVMSGEFQRDSFLFLFSLLVGMNPTYVYILLHRYQEISQVSYSAIPDK